MSKMKLTVLATLFIGLLGAAPTKALSTAGHVTYVTFDRTVALPGVQLPAGSYVFEAISWTSPSVVLVRTRDRSKVIIMKDTRQIDRPAGQPRDLAVTLGEAARGEAPPIRAWFPQDSAIGHEFVYRK